MSASFQKDNSIATSAPAIPLPLELRFSAYPFAPLRPRQVVSRLRWAAFKQGLARDLSEQPGHVLGELEHRLRLDLEADR